MEKNILFPHCGKLILICVISCSIRFNLFGEQMRNFREKRTAKILRTMRKCREKKLNQSKWREIINYDKVKLIMFSGQRVTQVFFCANNCCSSKTYGFSPQKKIREKKFTLVLSRNFAFFSYFVTEKTQNFAKKNPTTNENFCILLR